MQTDSMMCGMESAVNLQYLPCVNYSLVLNGIEVLNSMVLTNNTDSAWTDVVLTVSGQHIASSRVAVAQAVRVSVSESHARRGWGCSAGVACSKSPGSPGACVFIGRDNHRRMIAGAARPIIRTATHHGKAFFGCGAAPPITRISLSDIYSSFVITCGFRLSPSVPSARPCLPTGCNGSAGCLQESVVVWVRGCNRRSFG